MKVNFRQKIRSVDATTFNDVLLLPGYTTIEPEEANVSTRLSKDFLLNLPFISSPMDTVTESEMAIALARLGGLGIIHRNCSIEDQVDMVKKVKRAESFVISDVITITQNKTVEEALELMKEKNIRGLPVIEKNNELIGIVTWRDVRFAENISKILVKDVMTKKNDLITAPKSISTDEALRLMHKHRIEKLPVTENGNLIGLITTKDVILKGKFPLASRDTEGSLLCGAAISPFDVNRAVQLEKIADVLVTDVSHFHNKNCFEATKELLKKIEVPLIVGNVGTYAAASDVISKLEGVIGLRVGIGSGSICSTSVITRAGAPTLFATANCADAVKDLGSNLSIIADGGVKNPGDVAVAIAAGASAVMMGNVFARCKESPGEIIGIGGRYYKKYYGMGSSAARSKRFSLDRYSQPSKDITEGVEGYVPYRGPLSETITEFIAGLKAAMGYVGANSIKEMWEKAELAQLSAAGMRETNPHDIFLPDKNQSN
ncbi:MAG: IMP dehydrogenase [Candidatus Helarchaeota archaeon]